ncbi:MAG: hypothetical protein ABIX01_19745 [Chitinophagaceae bacterium]
MRKFLFSIGFFGMVYFASAQIEDMKPIPGAALYFSDKPFTSTHDGSKQSFKSSDFIYGRLELDKSLLEAFRMSSIKTKYYYLRYRLSVYKNGEQKGSDNPWQYMLIKDGAEKNNYLNFDVFPDPGKATSVMSGIEDYSAGLAAGPLYMMINQDHFGEDGEYTVKVAFFLDSYDAWGKREDLEKWPVVRDEFSFTFNVNDLSAIKKNNEVATQRIKDNAFKAKSIPDWFNNAAPVSDPKLSNANIATILKRDMPQDYMSLVKFNIAKFTGPLWMIEKNDLGLILRRYVNPNINIAYTFENKCYLGTARLWEEYIGGGKYGTLIMGGHTCNSCGTPIDCSLVK